MKKLLKWLDARNLALVLIGIPSLVSAIYLYLFAADRYVSESVITVKQSGDQPIGLAGLASIFQVSGSSAHSDLTLLGAHVRSMDMLQQLQKDLDLRQAYAAPKLDVLLRLSKDATDDEFLSYYRDRVEAHFDDNSGLLTLRTQGFSAEEAQAVNRNIVALSENFINEISQRLAKEQMRFATGELAKASEKYREAKLKMMAFQEKHRMVDPMAQMQASSAVTLELQARLSKLEAELKAAEAFMSPSSYQIQTMRQQVDALRGQLSQEGARGTGANGESPRLNSLAAEFREHQIDVNFAEEAFKAATISIETARLESTRKLKTLILVASPTLPQRPEYPRRAYDLLALMLAFSLVFGIVRLLVVTVEDHID